MQFAYIRAALLGLATWLVAFALAQEVATPRHKASALAQETRSEGGSATSDPISAAPLVDGVGKLPPGIAERTIDVFGRPMRLLVVRPRDASGTLPGVLLFQAGRNLDRLSTDQLARALARLHREFAAVLVSSTTSSDSSDSISPADAYFVTTWLAEHGGQFGIDGKRLSVFGVSPAATTRAPAELIRGRMEGFPRIRTTASDIAARPSTTFTLHGNDHDLRSDNPPTSAALHA